MNAVLILVDIIWLVAVAGVWTSTSTNEAWNSLHGLHIFALILSIINVLLKVLNSLFYSTSSDFKLF